MLRGEKVSLATVPPNRRLRDRCLAGHVGANCK